MSLAEGAKVAQYELVARLGGRGAEAWRARDTRLGREVALEFLGGNGESARLQQDARAASVLTHPGVLTVYDVGEHDGQPFLVSELLDGETLRDVLATSLLPRGKSLTLAMQLAQALAAAHEKGLAHRGMNPGSVFVTRDGRIKILGLGLPHGKTSCSSPEQIRGEPGDARSDVFSYGCIVYEMLCRRPAFTAMDDVLQREPPPMSPRPPQAVADLVARCLQKRPEGRFQSAKEVVDALVQVLMMEQTGEHAPLPSAGAGTGHSPGSYARLQALAEVLGRPVGAGTARFALRDLTPAQPDPKRAKSPAPPPEAKPRQPVAIIVIAAVALLAVALAIFFVTRRPH